MSKYQALKEALAADGLSDCPWVAFGPSNGAAPPDYYNEVVAVRSDAQVQVICHAPRGLDGACTADMTYIAEANPSTIRALLADLEAAEAENNRLREETVRDVMSKTMLTDVTIQNGSMGIQVEGGAAGMLANAFAEQFIDSGAVNYLEVSFHHEKVGGITVTLQRNSGKTPHMLRAEAEAERDAALAQMAGGG